MKIEVSQTQIRGDYSQFPDEPLTAISRHSQKEPILGTTKKGSQRSSIIALISCAMGAILLAFPSNAKDSGILLGVLLVIVCALISRLSMYLLLAVSGKTSISTFPALVQDRLGSKVKRAFEVNIIVYMFGILVCQQIIFTSFMWDACHKFGLDSDKETLMKAIFSFGFIICNFPISNLRDVYSLRHFAQLQLAVVVYIILAIVVYFFANFDLQNIEDHIVYFKVDTNIFGSFATTFFGYITHQMILPLKSELHNSSPSKMNKVCNRSTIAISGIYLIIMAAGYLTWFSQTDTLIIDNYHNMYFIVAKMLMALALFFSVSLNLNPLRLSFLECIDKKDSKPAFILSTAFFLLASGLLAYVYPNVKSGFGFVGGFLGLNMVVVIPCWMYVRTFGWNPRSYLITLVCVFSTTMGWLGAIFSQINKE